MNQYGFCQMMRCQQDSFLSGHLTGFFAAGNFIFA